MSAEFIEEDEDNTDKLEEARIETDWREEGVITILLWYDQKKSEVNKTNKINDLTLTELSLILLKLCFLLRRCSEESIILTAWILGIDCWRVA